MAITAAMREAQLLGRPALATVTDGSRLEDGATGYAVAWKKATPGKATWAGARKPTTRNMLSAPSPSQRTPRLPCGERPPTIRDQARNTRSWPGNTSPPSEQKSHESKSRSGGAQTRRHRRKRGGWRGGPNSPLTSQMLAEWNGSLSETRVAKSGRECCPLANAKRGISGKKWAKAKS